MKIPFTKYELRSTKQSRPDPWNDFWYANQSQKSMTGIDVNEDNALTFAAVWACVKVISEDIASLPLHVYKRIGKSKERAQDHPVYALLHDQPNPEMTAMQFREALQAHILLWGNAYAQIQRNLRGAPLALWPLHPGRMQVKRNEDAGLYYEYRLTKGDPILFAPDDILHIAGLGFNGLTGYSVIQYQKEAIALGISAQQYQATSYKNGGRLQLAFVHPSPKAPSEEGRKQFRKNLGKNMADRTGRLSAYFGKE
jgi:HK97 family phage portal protein